VWDSRLTVKDEDCSGPLLWSNPVILTWLALMLYFVMFAHKAPFQILLNAFLKTWHVYFLCCRCFSLITLTLTICPFVRLPLLNPACSFAMNPSACGFSLFVTLQERQVRLIVRYFWHSVSCLLVSLMTQRQLTIKAALTPHPKLNHSLG